MQWNRRIKLQSNACNQLRRKNRKEACRVLELTLTWMRVHLPCYLSQILKTHSMAISLVNAFLFICVTLRFHASFTLDIEIIFFREFDFWNFVSLIVTMLIEFRFDSAIFGYSFCAHAFQFLFRILLNHLLVLSVFEVLNLGSKKSHSTVLCFAVDIFAHPVFKVDFKVLVLFFLFFR